MSRQPFKQRLYAEIARVGKAVSQGHRLELLEHLAQGERSVETLARLCGLTLANASQHLQLLRRSGVVAARKEGLYVHYRLADDEVVRLVASLRRLAENRRTEVADLVQTYLGVKDGLEPLPRAELLERARRGLVTVLDVRPAGEYAAGHIAGAVNIPLKDLARRLQELPRRQAIVAYCRGPHCVLAFDAVAQLRRKGYRALRLEAGFPEWREAGLPVACAPREPGRGVRTQGVLP